MTANIFKIERLNTHNGPGFRTVVYFKGCPLHCTWCHNPESISKEKQVWVNHVKCIGCGECVKACEYGAVKVTLEKVEVNQQACVGCYACADACPTKAMEKIGLDYTIDDVMKPILQDKFLYESSGGGVTVTGGEPGLYIDFVTELFKQCKENGIQTAFDTSAVVSPEKLEELIKYTDILFLDLKIFDKQNSLKYTGLEPEKLSKMVYWLSNQKINPDLKIEFRTPVIPGITDVGNNLEAFAEAIVSKFPNAEWELCMFNDLCEDKYQKLGMDWTLSGQKTTEQGYLELQHFQKTYSEINIKLSGFTEDFSKYNE